MNRELKLNHVLAVTALGAVEGEKIEIALRGRDTDPGKGTAWTAGESFTLLIGGEGTVFYDVPANFPIARHAIIASGPFYTHKDIKTAGPILVSGLSFHGSSGSPVVTPFLGIAPGSVNTTRPRETGTLSLVPVVAEYRESRLIGIMTGRFLTRRDEFTPPAFRTHAYRLILNLIRSPFFRLEALVALR